MVWHFDSFEDGPTSNTNKFQPVLWAFGFSIEGFKSCHRIISINIDTMGTMVDSRVVAVTCQISGDDVGPVGVDANNQLYPLAFAIVEGENNDS